MKLEDAKAMKPLSLEHMENVLNRGRPANPRETAALIGECLRHREECAEDEPELEQMPDCDVCHNSGYITNEKPSMSLKELRETIDAEHQKDGDSRTEMALERGALQLMACPACGRGHEA